MNFPLVGTYCGNSIPAYFVSSGNFLTVQFVSDSSVQKQGFNATYKAVPRKNLLSLSSVPLQWFFIGQETKSID